MPAGPQLDYHRNQYGRYDCPERGCHKVGSFGLNSAWGVRVHLARKHHKTSPDAAPIRRRRPRMRVEVAPANGAQAQALALPAPSIEQQPAPSEEMLNYCPRCGCPMHTLRAALSPALLSLPPQQVEHVLQTIQSVINR